MNKTLTILILAGGKGERLLPLTKSIPKPLIKINKKEILSYVVDDLIRFKFKKMIILTGYKYQLIEKFIKKKYKKFENISTFFTGTNSDIATRIKKIFNQTSDDILICYGDTLANVNLDNLLKLQKQKKNKTLITTIQHKSSFGIIKLRKNKEIISFLEKPKLNLFINIGYILIKKNKLKDIFKFKNFQNFLKYLIKNNKVFSNVHKGKHTTVNTIYELEQAKKNLSK